MTKKASIVLPTYNESENIVEIVRALLALQPPNWTYECIVVDDNSPDHTYDIVRKAFENEPRVVPILRTTDRGMAKSIGAGVKRATGEWVVMMGSDFTHDPVEVPRLLHVAQIYDIVMGSRFAAGGNMEYLPHYLMSLVYNWFIRLVLRTQIQDNLGCFICIKRDVLESLPFDRIFYGYGDFGFRLLFYAQRKGRTVVELPARYKTRQKGNSKSHFFFLFFQYSIAVLKLRIGSVRDRLRSSSVSSH